MPVSQWVAHDPAPRLRPYIGQYVGYRLTGHPAGLHRGLPSKNLTLIFSIGSEIDVVTQTNPHQAPQRYRAVLGGLQAAPAQIAHDGNQEGVAVELCPIGARALLGLPAGELWNLSVEVDDVVGRPGREISERLHHAHGWEERIAICDEVLTGLLGEKAVSPELVRTWETLVKTGGTIPVGHLAAEIGYSRQHLRHKFSQEFGLGPKLAARLIRFDRARRMLERTPPFISTAQVALACGYYDQAHLHRDFAQLAGCTPAQLLEGDLPNLQDS